jgi:hypothetical protein
MTSLVGYAELELASMDASSNHPRQLEICSGGYVDLHPASVCGPRTWRTADRHVMCVVRGPSNGHLTAVEDPR